MAPRASARFSFDADADSKGSAAWYKLGGGPRGRERLKGDPLEARRVDPVDPVVPLVPRGVTAGEDAD